MSKALGIMNRLKGDVLLEGSDILTRIESLKAGLTYRTDDVYLSFDDRFLKLQAEIDSIPRIQLEANVHAGAAGTHYEQELLSALEEIGDRVERQHIKAISFMGQLTRAKADIEEMAVTFQSWYILAAAEVLAETDISLPATNIKGLAASEFNRLMDRSNLSIDALIEAIKIEIKRLESKRKMAEKKFQMGREQVNAAWANKLPESLGYSPNAPSYGLLKSGVIEEDLDEDPAPAFVSQSGEVVRSFQVIDPTVGLVSFVEGVDFSRGVEPANTFCGGGGEKQVLCPSGVMCANGHGGAPQLHFPPLRAEESVAEGLDSEKVAIFDEVHDRVVAPLAERLEVDLGTDLVDGHDVGDLIPSFLSDNAFDDEPASSDAEPGPIDRVIAKKAAAKMEAEIVPFPSAESNEIKGTFQKTGDAMPVGVLEPAKLQTINGKPYYIGMDVAQDAQPSRGMATVVRDDRVIEELEIKPLKAADHHEAELEEESPVSSPRPFDFDDFDDLDADPPNAVTSASLSTAFEKKDAVKEPVSLTASPLDDLDEFEPPKTRLQVSSALPKVAAQPVTTTAPKKAATIFDFDDDELN